MLLAVASATHTYGVTFNDFSSTAGLTVNGDAVGNLNNAIDPDPVLRLAPSATGQAGSAFTDTALNVGGFSTSFEFRITSAGGPADVTGQAGADGLTFAIQSIGPTALGGAGGGIGYLGISPSVAVEFDTFNNDPVNFPTVADPDSNHLGVDVNGSVVSLVTAAVAPRFDDGRLWHAWVDYDGTSLEVRASQTGLRPIFPNASVVIDIPATIGSTAGYVGFTAGTGAAVGDHDIVSWQFDSAIPEPATGVLGLLSLGALGLMTRRRP